MELFVDKVENNGDTNSHQNPADVLFGCRLCDMDIGNALRTDILHRCFSCMASAKPLTIDSGCSRVVEQHRKETSVTHESLTGQDYMGPVHASSYCPKFPKKRANRNAGSKLTSMLFRPFLYALNLLIAL
jgi:hypothetical protein